ncbi:MAG: MazG family protein [Opitutales bacterium]
MKPIEELLETVAALRNPETGCPWDIEQDHQSLAKCLIDECCELLETIDRLDMDHMEEELGDVLLQVLMHAQMAREAGHFDFDAVCRQVNEKLVRRHPHVFGDSKSETTDAVLRQWDAIKAGERKRGPEQRGRFKELPRQLPALLFAEDVCKQIRKREIPADAVLDEAAVAEMAADLDETSAGKRLFELAAACRLQGIDPESALRRYTQSAVDRLETT